MIYATASLSLSLSLSLSFPLFWFWFIWSALVICARNETCQLPAETHLYGYLRLLRFDSISLHRIWLHLMGHLIWFDAMFHLFVGERRRKTRLVIPISSQMMLNCNDSNDNNREANVGLVLMNEADFKEEMIRATMRSSPLLLLLLLLLLCPTLNLLFSLFLFLFDIFVLFNSISKWREHPQLAGDLFPFSLPAPPWDETRRTRSHQKYGNNEPREAEEEQGPKTPRKRIKMEPEWN